MKTEHLELWKRLTAWSPDAANGEAPFTFSQRLARENGWNVQFTRRVLEEYKRFAFLALAAGHPVTPSDSVDQVWHLHLTYSRSYWEDFTTNVLRGALHHDPTKGGEREHQKFNDWYRRTLESYRTFFHEAAPEDIWPTPEQRFDRRIEFVRLDRGCHWILPKPIWPRGEGRRFRRGPAGERRLARPAAAALTLACASLVLVGWSGALPMSMGDTLAGCLWVGLCLVVPVGIIAFVRGRLRRSAGTSALRANDPSSRSTEGPAVLGATCGGGAAAGNCGEHGLNAAGHGADPGGTAGGDGGGGGCGGGGCGGCGGGGCGGGA